MITSIYSDFNGALIKQKDGDVEKDIDLLAVKNSIINILQTRKGSRRMLPTFGCGIYYMLFEPLDSRTGHNIGDEIVRALGLWEPRVILNAVNINVNYDWNQYSVTINYSIAGRPSVSDTVKLILKAL